MNDQKTEEQQSSRAAFAVATGRTKGYHPAAVDTFLASARAAFEHGEISVRRMSAQPRSRS